MNNREITRYYKYIELYPILSVKPWKDELCELCVDPSIGFPPLKENQRQYRLARKNRDELVKRLYQQAYNTPSEAN